MTLRGERVSRLAGLLEPVVLPALPGSVALIVLLLKLKLSLKSNNACSVLTNMISNHDLAGCSRDHVLKLVARREHHGCNSPMCVEIRNNVVWRHLPSAGQRFCPDLLHNADPLILLLLACLSGLEGLACGLAEYESASRLCVCVG